MGCGIRCRASVIVAAVGVVSAAGSRGDEATAGRKPGEVPLRVRVLELEGMEWRPQVWRGLHPVQPQGATPVWTADARTLGRLAGHASSVQTLATGEPGDDSGASTRPTQTYVAWLDRDEKAPPGGASRVALVPRRAVLADGTSCDARGRRDGDGVVVKAEVRDTLVLGMHTVNCTENVFRDGVSRSMARGVYQVPEVINQAVTGSWKLPAGEAIVIGLGVHTVPGARPGLTVLRERFVLIDARDLDESAFQRGTADTQTIGRASPGRTLTVGLLGRAAVWATVLGLPLTAAGLFGWFLGRGRGDG